MRGGMAKANDQLTKRERDVLAWMGKGKRNGEIALILGISPATVKKHAENIFKKLHVENRTAAAMAFTEKTRENP